ncbi:hypothetical protein NH340_JMT03775 [Sarcoptes scabiei]|nr:hypothetical protein NH340_JMT03775 [Sarcoptes scabiei]
MFIVCKTCILKYFDDNNNPKAQSCPKCLKQVHSTKPKVNIRSDPTLQDIVYKLVPGLFKNEMMRRKEYFMRYPEKASGLSNEEKGEMNGERLILSTDDYVQITIEYFPEVTNPYKLLPFNNNENLEIQLDNLNQRRYLLCKAGMRVLHLKKFIRSKYELESNVPVDFFYKHELLEDNYTIMDLAYIYSWRRQIPIPLYYLILEPDKTRDDYLWLISKNKQNSFTVKSDKSSRSNRIKLKKYTKLSPKMCSENDNLVVNRIISNRNSSISSNSNSSSNDISSRKKNKSNIGFISISSNAKQSQSTKSSSTPPSSSLHKNRQNQLKRPVNDVIDSKNSNVKKSKSEKRPEQVLIIPNGLNSNDSSSTELSSSVNSPIENNSNEIESLSTNGRSIIEGVKSNPIDDQKTKNFLNNLTIETNSISKIIESNSSRASSPDSNFGFDGSIPLARLDEIIDKDSNQSPNTNQFIDNLLKKIVENVSETFMIENNQVVETTSCEAKLEKSLNPDVIGSNDGQDKIPDKTIESKCSTDLKLIKDNSLDPLKVSPINRDTPILQNGQNDSGKIDIIEQKRVDKLDLTAIVTNDIVIQDLKSE